MAEAATCFTSLAGRVSFYFFPLPQHRVGIFLFISFCRHTSDSCFLQGSLPGSVRARKSGGRGHGFSTWWCGWKGSTPTVRDCAIPESATLCAPSTRYFSCLECLARSRRWRFQGRHRQQNDASGKRNPVRVPGLADSELACAFFFLTEYKEEIPHEESRRLATAVSTECAQVARMPGYHCAPRDIFCSTAPDDKTASVRLQRRCVACRSGNQCNLRLVLPASTS